MIDNSASKYSEICYGQFMTYTKDIKYMTIDITTADVIHV